MIQLVNYDNLDRFGGLFAQHFKLRYQEFIIRQQYEVPTYREMEYDQYDNPCASYLIYADEQGNALAANRLLPTARSCMLRDLWPHLVEDKSLLQAEDVWEGSRYCIHHDIDGATRTRIIHEMAVAYLEFGLRRGLRRIIGMMPTYIYRSVFERPGIEMEYLGPIERIGRHNIRAVAIPVEQKQLDNVRQKTGIAYDVLNETSTFNESEYLHARAA